MCALIKKTLNCHQTFSSQSVGSGDKTNVVVVVYIVEHPTTPTNNYNGIAQAMCSSCMCIMKHFCQHTLSMIKSAPPTSNIRYAPGYYVATIININLCVYVGTKVCLMKVKEKENYASTSTE